MENQFVHYSNLKSAKWRVESIFSWQVLLSSFDLFAGKILYSVEEVYMQDESCGDQWFKAKNSSVYSYLQLGSRKENSIAEIWFLQVEWKHLSYSLLYITFSDFNFCTSRVPKNLYDLFLFLALNFCLYFYFPQYAIILVWLRDIYRILPMYFLSIWKYTQGNHVGLFLTPKLKWLHPSTLVEEQTRVPTRWEGQAVCSYER